MIENLTFTFSRVDTNAIDKEATNKLKRSKSLSLDETDELKRKEASGEKSRKHRHHRHHHQRHHHARHLKNKGLNAQDTLESRIRSGMHALEEERKALREIVDEIETFGEKDRDDITCKNFFEALKFFIVESFHFSNIN